VAVGMVERVLVRPEYAALHYRGDRYRFIIELAGSSAPRRIP